MTALKAGLLGLALSFAKAYFEEEGWGEFALDAAAFAGILLVGAFSAPAALGVAAAYFIFDLTGGKAWLGDKLDPGIDAVLGAF